MVEMKQLDLSKINVGNTRLATCTTYNLLYQTDTAKVPLRVPIDSIYGEAQKDLFGQYS